MSAEALQTLQIAAITLACVSGLFGEIYCSTSTQELSRFFDEQEYMLYSLGLRSGQRTGMPQCHRRD